MERKYTIARVIDGNNHVIELTAEEIGHIVTTFSFDSKYESVYDKLKSDYELDDEKMKELEETVMDVYYCFEKTLDHCSYEEALEIAFDEYEDWIRRKLGLDNYRNRKD